MEAVRSLFLKSRALLDELSEDGSVLPDADVIDMQLKYVLITDMGHKELYEIARSDETQEEPTTITSIDDTTEINYKADQALAYYGASRLAFFENKELVNPFEQKYEELKRKCANKAVEIAITDVYGISPVVDEEAI